MNLERLRAVQAEEREADSLRALPDSFYREVAEYLEELRAQRASAADAADDPFDSAAVRRLTDEIETAEEVAEAIYERRVGKLVKRASLAAAGMPADDAGLTAEEAELFATLVDRIEAHREDVLDAFDGERAGTNPDGLDGGATGRAPDGVDDATGPVSEPGGSTVEAGSSMPTTEREDGPPGGSGSGNESASDDGDHSDGPPASPDDPASAGDDAPGAVEATTDGPDTERLTLRITADVGEVFGVDERVYDLAAEDVVTLPAANAKPLLESDAAERIE